MPMNRTAASAKSIEQSFFMKSLPQTI